MMAAATKEPTRAEVLADYIERDAISTVLHALVGNFGVPNAEDSSHATTAFRPPWNELVNVFEPYLEGSEDALGKAFPDEYAEETAEWRDTKRRADLLTARLLAALAANSDYLARTAAWILDGTARELAAEAKGGGEG
jgi:hypothetical protein